VTVVVSPEARGFVLGALVARELGIGLVLVRKHGSHHPGASVQVRTAPGLARAGAGAAPAP
jgi:adenine/guanine phosphoribosyltransferase-like PRPP-binding protein